MTVRHVNFVGVAQPAESFFAGLHNHVEYCTALHEPLHQDHLKWHLHCLIRELQAVQKQLPDDPLLQAYLLEDRMGKLVGWFMKAHIIATRYIKATPDQLPKVG